MNQGENANVGTGPHRLEGTRDASKVPAEAGQISHSPGHSNDRCNLSSGTREPETKGKRGIYWVRLDGRSFHEQYVVELF